MPCLCSRPICLPFATSLSRTRAGVFEKRARAMRCSRDCSVVANQKSYSESVTLFARLLTNQQSCTYRTESCYGLSKCFCPIGARFKYPGIFESALYTRLSVHYTGTSGTRARFTRITPTASPDPRQMRSLSQAHLTMVQVLRKLHSVERRQKICSTPQEHVPCTPSKAVRWKGG